VGRLPERQCLERGGVSVRRVAIVNPVRTPVGLFGGILRPLPVEDLAASVVSQVLTRSKVDPGRIDDVVFAQSYANSETPCIGRWTALHADLPLQVPGMQVDRRCGGGLQALLIAAMQVQTGSADIVIAGGVESMSNIELYNAQMRWGTRTGGIQLYDRLERGRERAQPEWRFGHSSGMVETAETLATVYGISRKSCDEYAARSHQRAAAAWDAGLFEAEVVPVAVPVRRGDPTVVTSDEGVRPDCTVESLATMTSILPGGVVTAGNSCQQNDAAAACLVVAEDVAEQLGLIPMGFLVGSATVGCDPLRMGIGPVPAVEKLFARTGLSFADLDLVELNEAFAAQVLAVLAGWNWNDPDVLNVNGGAIALGHPIAATGIRMLTSLLYELDRRNGRRGMLTMCIGGGQGMAAVVERP
jgi:acetyl-CoA C-acetyltransferase